MTQDQKDRHLFIFLLFAHACFILYGSLVPFEFEAIKISQAWESFRAILIKPPAIFSNANLLANVIIGIPGPFLFLAGFHIRPGRPGIILIIVAVLYSTLLASAAEFLQLFTPIRMPLLSDILAQTAGGIIGVISWLWIGVYFRKMMGALVFQDRNLKPESFVFLGYLMVLFLIYCLPLDLSARPGPLYSQWEKGKIVLVPFANWTGGMDFLKNLSHVVLWIPVAWFLTHRRGWPFLKSFFAVFAAIFCLETVKLFILSRSTDVTNIVLAGSGGLVGACFGGSFGRNKMARPPVQKAGFPKKVLLPGFTFFLWLAFVVVIFWMPFSFSFDPDFLRKRVGEFGLIPLQLYLGKPYMQSAYNILNVIVYFIPLGVLFSSFVTRHFSGDHFKMRYFFFLIITCLLAGMIEFGQFFIPERYPDTTDWLCMVCGAMLGHSGARMFWRKTTDGITHQGV